MSSSPALTKIQIQAEARLRTLAGKGNPVAIAHLRGFKGYEADPIGFNDTHLGAHFTDDIKSVIESVRDHTVTIAISANAVGKSFAAAHIAAWFYKVFTDSKVFLSAAPPENNLKEILWSELGGIIRRKPFLFTSDKVSEEMKIKRNKESFISGLVIPTSGTPAEREAKFSGKHAPHLLFIVDEGDAVPASVYRGIESCMSGGHARLLIMFNPRADRGYVANMVKRRQGNIIYLSAFDHPNVISGENKIPGAVTRENVVMRINDMTTPLASSEKPSVDCFEVPAFLVNTTTEDKAGVTYPPLPAGHRRVHNMEFFYKVIGQYPPESESQLISKVYCENAKSRWLAYVAMYGEVPPPQTIPICALDVADGGDLNVLTQKWGTWIPRLRAWEGVDPEAAAVKTAGIVKSLEVDITKVIVNVDSTGVGAGVPGRLRGLGLTSAKRIMVASAPTINIKASQADKAEAVEFYQLRDQLWWSAMLWLKNDTGAMIPPDDELEEELTTPTYWKGERDGKIRISTRETMIESLGRSPDKASSLVLLFSPTKPGWTR